jgi:hypothetical protein
VFFPTTNSSGGYYNQFDDFTVGNNWAASAVNSCPATCTAGSYAQSSTVLDNNHPSNWAIASGFSSSATGAGESIGPNGGAAMMFDAATNSNPWTWEAEVYVPVLPGTTAATYNVGLSHSNFTTVPWGTGINFSLSSGNGTANNWYCQYSGTTTNTTTAATAAWVRLTIQSDGTKVHWYINGSQVCGTGVVIGSMPTATLEPAFAVAAQQETTSMLMYIDYEALQMAVTR